MMPDMPLCSDVPMTPVRNSSALRPRITCAGPDKSISTDHAATPSDRVSSVAVVTAFACAVTALGNRRPYRDHRPHG
jgi:hypothetical protein